MTRRYFPVCLYPVRYLSSTDQYLRKTLPVLANTKTINDFFFFSMRVICIVGWHCLVFGIVHT